MQVLRTEMTEICTMQNQPHCPQLWTRWSPPGLGKFSHSDPENLPVLWPHVFLPIQSCGRTVGPTLGTKRPTTEGWQCLQPLSRSVVLTAYTPVSIHLRHMAGAGLTKWSTELSQGSPEIRTEMPWACTQELPIRTSSHVRLVG